MRNIEKIIILRFRRVGDAVLSSVLCSSLRKTFPNAKIHYVLNEEIAPLFEGHPDIDKIITFQKEEMKDLKTYLRKVRAIMKSEKYDIIIDTRATIKTLWFSLFSLATPYRIGKKKIYNPFLHNYRVNIDFDGEENEVDSTLRLLSPLKDEFEVVYDPYFKLHIDPKEKKAFRSKMENAGIDFSKPVILCAITTRLAGKAWDMKKMRQLLDQVVKEYNVQLVFNYGGEIEKKTAIALHQAMDNHPAIFTNIEATNLKELAALVANSNFFFGNEGGPRHISQALNVYSFAIYPPHISKKQWLPYASEFFQGIEPSDFFIGTEEEKLSYHEKFELITVNNVWLPLKAMIDNYLIKIS